MSDDSGTNFVVFTTQRSGSTWLMSVLNSIEDVSAHGELFLPRPRSTEKRWDSGFQYPRYVESRAQHGSIRPFSVFSYLTTLYSSPGSIGFKLMYSQLRSFPELLMYLTRNRIHVIHLVRRNHLDVIISFAIKQAIGKAHILSGENRPKDVRIDIDTTSIVRDLKWLQFKHDVGRQVLRTCKLRHLEVAYEDLLNDQSCFSELIEFLNIAKPEEIPQSHILKTRLGNQKEVIKNYEEVKRALENTRFAALLE